MALQESGVQAVASLAIVGHFYILEDNGICHDNWNWSASDDREATLEGGNA